MVACSKKRKNECIQPCTWVKGKGCKNVQRVSCSSKRKKDCLAPCQWKVGIGCKYIEEETNKSNKSNRSNKSNKNSQSHNSNDPCEKSKCLPGTVIAPDNSKCVELKYIGSGTYGCVISPPVIEKTYILQDIMPYVQRENNDIAKIYISGFREFQHEFKILKQIQAIDANNTFTVMLKGAQKINGKCFENSDVILNCLKKMRKYIKNNKAYYQIIMENAGIQTNDDYRITYIDFLQFFKTFLEGMIKLQNNNLVHRDIKPHNVLITDKKINLIDFGLLCKANQVYTNESRYLLKALDYPYYPPEFYIAYIMMSYRSLYENNRQNFESFVDTIYQRMNNNNFFKQRFLLSSPELTYQYSKGVTNFLRTMKAQQFTKYDQIFNAELAMKADVFSMGYIIAAINKNIVYSFNTEKEFVDYIYLRCMNPNVYERISLLELYSAVNNEMNRSLRNSNQIVTGGSKKLIPLISTTVDTVNSILNYPTPAIFKTFAIKKRSKRKSVRK